MDKCRASLFVVCSLVAAVAAVAGAQDALQGFDPATRIYVVQPGDTLWDLSGQAYQDPWKWPRIWENNPAITNPHAIYPDQQLTMPYMGEPPTVVPAPVVVPEPVSEPPAPLPEPEVVAVAEPAPEPKAEEALEILESGTGAEVLTDFRDEQKESRLVVETAPRPSEHFSSIYVRLGSEGMVTTDFSAADIEILGSAEERKIFAVPDEVFLSQGSDHGVVVGDRYAIYDVGDAVRDPVSRNVLGTSVVMLGWLEVVRVAEQTSVGLIRESFSEIESKHALVKMDADRPGVVVPRFNEHELRGRVVWTQHQLKTIGAYQVLYINLGDRDGISEGDLLGIYRDLGSRRDREQGLERRLPDYQIAVGVAIDVQDNVTTVLVVRSSTDIARGDEVRTLAAGS